MQIPRVSFQIIKQEQKRPQPLQILSQIKYRPQGIQIHQKAKHILQPSFVLGILGPPSSGKSTIIQQLIVNQQFFAYKFDRILYIGPTKYNKFVIQQPIIQDSYNWKQNFDLKWIYQHIKQARKWQCKNMLLVFDDVISQLKDPSIAKLTSQLFYNRRHLIQPGNISIIVTSQKWSFFPKFVRTAINQLFLFNTNKYQIQSVYKQTNLPTSKTGISQLINQLKPHQFIFINFSKGILANKKWQVL